MSVDRTFYTLRGLALALLLGLGLAACDEPGPAEQAGGEAGAAIDDAVEALGEATESAGQAIRDAVD